MPDQPEAPRRAWYARSAGAWRDWVDLLHLPYTLWHLSYVLVGAGLAAHIKGWRLAGTVLAFFLAVGVAAHALDELNGRPLATKIPSRALVAAAAVSLAAATIIGMIGIAEVGAWLVPFILVGIFLVVGYNLELWDGRFHRAEVFALGWGSFPVLTSYFAQTGTIRISALIGALFAFGLSMTQRILSVEARNLRRNVEAVSGEKRYLDGKIELLSRSALLRPLERALATLSWTAVALGIALVDRSRLNWLLR